MQIQWPLVLFTVLAGAGACLIAFAALNELLKLFKDLKVKRAAYITGIILVIVGGICSAFHLTHLERMLLALNNPLSGIFTEALMVGLVSIVTIILLVLLHRRVKHSVISVVAVISMIMGVLLALSNGIAYMMDAQFAWNTVFLPLSYVSTSAVAGAALYCVILSFCPSDEDKRDILSFMSKALLITSIISLIILVIYTFIAGSAHKVGVMPYVIGYLVLTLVSLLSAFLMIRKQDPKLWSTVACVSALIASILLRCFMWVSGSAVFQFFGQSHFGSI